MSILNAIIGLIGGNLAFSIITFITAMAYLLASNDIVVGLPAFLLAYSGYDDKLRVLTIFSSFAVILGCLYRLLNSGFITEMPNSGLPTLLTLCLLILASINAYTAIK
jgi:hypothetical protein